MMKSGTPRDRGEASPPPADSLPPGGSRVDRISEHGQALFQNIKEWVEWRVELTRIKARERIRKEREKLILIAVAGVLGALAGFFALVTLSLGIGWLLGHAFWGFLIVFVLLAVGAFLFYGAYQALTRKDQDEQ